MVTPIRATTVRTMIATFFMTSYSTNLHRKTVQEGLFSREPCQLVEEDEAPDEKEQRTAEEFHGVQVFPEIFVETQELAEEDGGQKKRNGESGGVDGQEKNAAGNGFAGGGASET